MGMFDSVWAECPKCSAMIEYQSKAGKCELIDYDADAVPPELARDLNGGKEKCESCGAIVGLYYEKPIKKVEMVAVAD